MTRAKVIQLGLLVLALGAIVYEGFRFIGLDGASSGIASEALLVALVVIWIGTYLVRVVRGKMTFNEQRERYLKAFIELSDAELQARFESMSEEEQNRFLTELDSETKPNETNLS